MAPCCCSSTRQRQERIRWRLQMFVVVVVLVLLRVSGGDAFCPRSVSWSSLTTSGDAAREIGPCRRARVIGLPATTVTSDDVSKRDVDDDDDAEDDEIDEESDVPTRLKSSRWESLNPRIKERIIKAGQERAIANKKKREPAQAKKRRMMMFVKEKEREKKRLSKVRRPLPFSERTPLSALVPGMEIGGVVISLTKYGAYVDVGTECDGLLHVSQLSHTDFIEHPRQVLSPGDEITVRVRSFCPDRKKLHLTMLPREILEAEKEDEDDDEDRIPLEDIEIDDELWGEVRRVTNYGAYVEVGAVVDGFLHFMDHPAFGWSAGRHPTEFISAKDRVRVWVTDVDRQRQRIKLTANRPPHLPGPRREL